MQPAAVPGAAKGLPILDGAAHVGNRRDTVFQQNGLRGGQSQIAVLGPGRGHMFVDQALRVIDEHAGGFAGFSSP